jgi:hypothetical protein
MNGVYLSFCKEKGHEIRREEAVGNDLLKDLSIYTVQIGGSPLGGKFTNKTKAASNSAICNGDKRNMS